MGVATCQYLAASDLKRILEKFASVTASGLLVPKGTQYNVMRYLSSGLQQQGIYRIAGTMAEVKSLKNELNKGMTMTIPVCIAWNSESPPPPLGKCPPLFQGQSLVRG